MANRYFSLALFLGIAHKLFDDLYDNNLYHCIHIEERNVAYVNEFLKCVFSLGYAVLSLHYLFFYVFFTVVNTILYSLKKNEYGPYEFSGLLSSAVLIPFLPWHQASRDEWMQNMAWLIVLFVGCFVLEKICNRNANTEFSDTKLMSRCVALLVTVMLLFANGYYGFLSETVRIILFFNVGYLVTSCAFQYYLLFRECANTNINTNININNNEQNTSDSSV